MRLSRTRVPVRTGLAAAAGLVLALPVPSVAIAAPDYSLTTLPALATADFVTVDATTLQQAPQLTTEVGAGVDPNYLLATPAPGFGGGAGGGAVIYENSGQPVWMQPGNFLNFEQILYQGQPALVTFNSLRGTHVIYDQSYREVGTISMGNGLPTDGHDISFTEDGSRALLQGTPTGQANLSQFGGAANATVLDAVLQEIDVATGEVLWQWSALENISPGETTEPLVGLADPYHINAVTYDSDGNVLMSLRNTSTVYKIDRQTGEIIWRLGGENSDFTYPGGDATRQRYQHDAARLPDGTLSVFDNGNTRQPQQSRGLIYQLDETAMTATIVQELHATPELFTPFIGNNRRVPNGNQLVNFGITGWIVEYADGEPVFGGNFAQGITTYRVDRTNNWTGTPAAPPAVVVGAAAGDGSRTLNVSWNGATEVEAWKILAGPSEDQLTEVGTTPRTGFETAVKITAPSEADVFRVVAVDDGGSELVSHTVPAR